MKILSYNIMSGGFNGYDDLEEYPQRLDFIKKVVSEVNPDIVSLVDTFRWDEIYSERQIGEIFNYKYVHCVNLNDARLRKLGHNNGITVLSNVDGTKFETVDLITRNCVHTSVQEKRHDFSLFSLYLDDLEEDIRINQANELKKYINDNSTVIMGDLNTFSPVDALETKKEIDAFLLQNPQYNGLKYQLHDMSRAKVIELFNKMKFKDASKNYEKTFPTSLINISKKPLVRVDHCLYKNIVVKSFQVLKGEIFEKTSDHYPILVEI